MQRKDQGLRYPVLSALISLGTLQFAGCANVASLSPADVIAGVGKGAGTNIVWSRDHGGENWFYGFPALERELDPILEKCRQQKGSTQTSRASIRFVDSSAAGQSGGLTRDLPTEIQCRKAGLYRWVAKINYRNYLFTPSAPDTYRLQIHLRTEFVAGDALNLPQDEESKRRRVEAAAAAEKRYEDYVVQRDREQKAEREALAERERAAAEQRRAELPAFRARLKPGDRVGILHPQFRSVSAVGLVIDVKLGLAQVQFRATPNILNPDPKTETLWFQVEQLVQPEW